jgi:type IV secretion system protein VirB10
MSIFPFRRPEHDANDDADNIIDGERSVPSVNKGLGMQAKITNMVIIATLLGLVVFLLFRYYSAAYTQRQEAKAAGIVTTLPPLVTPTFPEAPAQTSAGGTDGAPPPMNAPAAVKTVTGTDGKPVLTPAQIVLNRRLDSPLRFNVEGVVASASPAMGMPAGSDMGRGQAGSDDPLSKSLQPAHFVGAKAYMLPDPSMMLTQGAGIPCTVIPAIDTTLPGIVTCIQSADVRGADGKVVLLERGTKWVGQQKFGMQQGQRRVGILWARGETPNHVLVDVDSAGGDALGRTGIDGVVDNHFWDRFGAAILMSFISDVGSYLASTQQSGGSGNTSIAFPATATAGQSVMSDILKTTLNIPPTLTKNQGAEIIIYVARDLDFRDVYELQAKK